MAAWEASRLSVLPVLLIEDQRPRILSYEYAAKLLSLLGTYKSKTYR